MDSGLFLIAYVDWTDDLDSFFGILGTASRLAAHPATVWLGALVRIVPFGNDHCNTVSRSGIRGRTGRQGIEPTLQIPY